MSAARLSSDEGVERSGHGGLCVQLAALWSSHNTTAS